MYEFLFIKLQFHIIILNSSQSSIKHDIGCLWAPQTKVAFINGMSHAHMGEILNLRNSKTDLYY